MLSYQQTAAPATLWPEPMELIWQMQSGDGAVSPRWKRQDIVLPDRAFIGAVVNLPSEVRPWGAITWLSDVYRTSRETIYAIGERTKAGLLHSVEESVSLAESVDQMMEQDSPPEPEALRGDYRSWPSSRGRGEMENLFSMTISVVLAAPETGATSWVGDQRLVGQAQLRQPCLTSPQVGHLQAFPQVKGGVEKPSREWQKPCGFLLRKKPAAFSHGPEESYSSLAAANSGSRTCG